MARSELEPRNGPAAFVGAKIRHFRESAGLTQQQLAEQTNYSPSLIGMIEQGYRGASSHLLIAADEVLNAGGMLDYLAPLARTQSYKTGFAAWLPVEREAVEIINSELNLVPGLLQTEDYTRALYRGFRPNASETEIEELTQARLERQSIMEGENPPALLALLDDNVLTRKIGSATIMAEQLGTILRIYERTDMHLHVQVIPSQAGAYAGLEGSMVLATLRDGSQMALFDATPEAHVTSHPDDLSEVRRRLDAMRLDALPVGASIQHIETVMETWKAQT